MTSKATSRIKDNNMDMVFNQQFEGGYEISCYYGTPPDDIFEGDVIRLCLAKGDDVWVTPDEAATLIRALSAGLSHYLVEEDRLAKLKGVEHPNLKEKS
jgi:hypothetical protein